MRYAIYNLQEKEHCQKMKNLTVSINIDQHEYLKFHHPKDAFAKNLRGYISTVKPALKCIMDMQHTADAA